jgi:NagD protein
MSNVDLGRIRHVALDMDGTIYRGGTLFDFTPAFLARMRALGIGYTFLTNNSSKSLKDYVAHLRRMGIEAEVDQLHTSTLSAMDYLGQELPSARRLYVLGTSSLQQEFREAGFTVVDDVDEPQAVVVGFDTALSYPRLCRTAWWIKQGKPFIATHPDFVCPTDQPTVLVDCGAVCACLTSATGRGPDAVLGKPDPRMLTGILARHGLEPAELAMVGDRIYTDMAMAHRAGCLGVLVLTGEATAADAAACSRPPDLMLESLKQLGELLAGAREMQP